MGSELRHVLVLARKLVCRVALGNANRDGAGEGCQVCKCGFLTLGSSASDDTLGLKVWDLGF